MIKHGSFAQKTTIITALKPFFVQLMQQKYSYHLACRAYYYSPTKALRTYFHTQINGSIGKLVLHQYAAEVIEYIYGQLAPGSAGVGKASENLSASEMRKARQNMVHAFYGQYFLIMKQVQGDDKDLKPMSLRDFLSSKPQLQEQVLGKIEETVQKLIEKGQARHSIVQAIVCDYIRAQTDVEKIKFLGDCMKEKMPSLLGSKPGLEVACSLFNVLDAKDRKTVVKSLQEPLNEMSLNRVAHLFIIHILNNLDDTVVSKKKIIHDLMLKIDDNVTEKTFQNIFIGIYAPNSKRHFDAEEIAAFEAFQEHTTSKKDAATRRLELMQAVCGPLEKFFEEGMAAYL
jgi:hypothetical protein